MIHCNYTYIYTHTHTYIYIYTNLTVNAIVRLPHPRSEDSQGQKTFLAPSAEKQTRNYDIECSNHHMYISFYDTDPQARNICCTQK